MSKKKIYIAGKISGLTLSQYEENFKIAATKLLDLGFKPVSPIINPNEVEFQNFM